MNARQRILEAVTGTVKEHGWEPVLGTTECHSLTCAGMLAANAKANYVLALLGAYDPPAKYTTFYANDVGVSLWRDGGVVASRTEADEQADFDKAGGGAFAACGPPTGYLHSASPDVEAGAIRCEARRQRDGRDPRA